MESSAPTPAPMPAPRQKSFVGLIVVIVIAVVAIAFFLAVGLPLIQQSVAAPKITLTDATYTTFGCGLFGPYYYTFTWTFTLVNTGNADGFATVTFYVNGEAVAYNLYFVPAGAQITRIASVRGPDHGGWPCPDTDSPSLAITSVSKA